MLVLPVMEYSLTINDSSHTTTGDETDVRAFAESVLGAGRKADSFVEAALAMLATGTRIRSARAGTSSRSRNRGSE